MIFFFEDYPESQDAASQALGVHCGCPHGRNASIRALLFAGTVISKMTANGEGEKHPIQVDNWSHIGGFCFGAVSGIVFLPYITFGKWDARRKRILLLLCIPLLMIMFIVAFVMFYLIQNPK